MEAEELFDWIKEALIDKIDKSRIIEEIDMSLDEYASTKAEEELEKFMTTLDIKEDRKVIRKLRRYIIQYKQQP